MKEIKNDIAELRRKVDLTGGTQHLAYGFNVSSDKSIPASTSALSQMRSSAPHPPVSSSASTQPPAKVSFSPTSSSPHTMDDNFVDFSLCSPQEYFAHESRLYQRVCYHSKIRLGNGKAIAV